MARKSQDSIYDDLGDGKYDLIPVARRVPLHAEKAEEFLGKGDLDNALSHAKTCVSLAHNGYLQTPPHTRVLAVLAELQKRGIR